MTKVLNKLETEYPKKFNKNTVYASIADEDRGSGRPDKDSAVFTTFDSSKGLERKVCVVFDCTEKYWDIRIRQPNTRYEILRNIFCVAMSRGKDRIVFVKSGVKGDDAISTKTLLRLLKITSLMQDRSISAICSVLSLRKTSSVVIICLI